MANTAAQSARALEPFLEADFSAEEHVAGLVGTHRPFPTLRADVADAKRIGIQRLQALVHSNHRTFLQSSRAMATVLRDLGTLKSGVTSIKQAVASMCAVTFAHHQTREAYTSDYSGAAGDTAARSALGAALAGVDGSGPTALSARLSASCTIPAMAMVSGGAGSSSKGGGPSSRSGIKASGATASSVRGGPASSTAATAAAGASSSSGAPASGSGRGAGYWRGVSDAVDIALAARKYDEAVDRVVAAAAMAAGDGTVEPSVMLLENRVVRAVDAELRAMPQVAFELHRPLLVCLLDLGRVYDASEAFLRSQSAWLQEVQRDVAADSGDDWAACTHVMDATVAIVGHTLDAHQDLFRGAELSKLTLWAQEAMRDVAQRFLLPTMRSAFSVAAGGGTVAASGGAPNVLPSSTSRATGRDTISGPPSRNGGAACLPVFDALALAAECAGKAGTLASSGGGALGTTVADALVPGLIQLVEAHVAAAEHEALIDGGECAAGLVHRLVTTVGRFAGYRKDVVEAEDSPFAGDRQASRLWADLLRCAPVKLHGRTYLGGVGRYLDTVLPASFAHSSDAGAVDGSPIAQGPASATSKPAATSRFQSASSTSSSRGAAAATPTTSVPSFVAKSVSLPHSARQQRAIMRSLWLGEGTLRLLTRALELLPPPEGPPAVLSTSSSAAADREAAAEVAAMQSVRGSPLFVDVLDAAMQQLLRSHLFDLRRARDDVYAKHSAGLLEKLQTASTPPGSPGAAAVTAEELGLDNAEDADFLPAAFIAPGDARLAGSYVAAVAGITFLSWAHPQHFAGARSHHTASLAEKAVSFGRARLLRPLVTAPSPLSIVSGSAAELERYDRDLESAAYRLERFALTAYNSANATPDTSAVIHQGAAAPAVAKSRHGGRLFGFYFEDVESASARDVSGLLPFTLLLLLKVRQLAFAHVAAFAGNATAACVGREAVVALTEELLCTRDFWATHLQAFTAGSAAQQAVAKEQIAMFFGAWLHGAEPLLRCPIFFPTAPASATAAAPAAASISVWERAQDVVRTFLADVINCRTVSLEAAVRNAATSLAGQAFEMHDDPAPVAMAGPPGLSPQPPSGAAKAETAVSIASLREAIHAAMGDVAADAVLPAV